MRAQTGSIVLAGSLALLTSTGCHSYQPTYAPPPYAGGAVYPAPVYSSPGPALGSPTPVPIGPGGPTYGPPTALPPGGSFPPPGSPGPGGPGVYPTPAEPWSSGSSNNAGPGDAQPFTRDPSLRGAPPPTSRPGDPNLVPNYDDPANLPFDNTSAPKDDPFGTPSPFQPDFRKDQTQRQDAKDLSGPAFAEVSATSEPEMGVQQVSATRTVPSHTARGPQPNPFDYDRKGYRWLRGVVDYDAQNKSWHIAYSQQPEPSDPWQGQVQLLGAETLCKDLQPGDVVLVEGRIQAKGPDGAARYQVERMFGPLVPKTTP